MWVGAEMMIIFKGGLQYSDMLKQKCVLVNKYTWCMVQQVSSYTQTHLYFNVLLSHNVWPIVTGNSSYDVC